MNELVAQPEAPELAHDAWSAVRWFTCTLVLEVPVPQFTVGDLLRLAPGDVVNSEWLQGADIPLRVNGEVIGWTEFEVVDNQLAIRLTQLA